MSSNFNIHPTDTCTWILENGTYKFANDIWYRWAGTHYEMVRRMEDVVCGLMNLQLGNLWRECCGNLPESKWPERPMVSVKKLLLVMAELRLACAADPVQPVNCVNFKNCVIDLRTRKREPHSPDNFFVGQPRTDFDLEARAPRWQAFLREIWPDDPEAIRLLQKWFWYVLSGETRDQKALLLVGASRGGKGLIARVLADLVPNHVGISLSVLGSEFGLSTLIGASLAIVDEATISFRTDRESMLSNILSVIGESPVTCNRKYGGIQSLVLPTRFLFTANDTPNFGDVNRAMHNRLLYLAFTRSWAGKEDTSLLDVFRGELAGIFNWALAGSCIAGWPTSKGAAEIAEDSLRTNNPLLSFVEDCLVFEEGKTIPKAEVYQRYKNWCEETGHRNPLSREIFARRLKALRPDLEDGRPRVEGQGPRPMCWLGVRLQ
jgi:putative DNA primase/helicase